MNRENKHISAILRTGKFRILALAMASTIFFSACTQGVKFHPSDRTDPAPEVAAKQTEDVPKEAKANQEEPAETTVEVTTAAVEDNTEAVDEEAAKTDESTEEKAEKVTTAPTEPEPQNPTVQEVKSELKKEEFSFYVNNLVTDPEPSSVVYGDKQVGKAELTVFYAYFDSQEEADQAIANLLESDMIGKALSFGAELEKIVDESGNKVYTVNLSSWLATARAEMRQDGERCNVF